MGSSRSAPTVELQSFRNNWYSPGRAKLVQALWFFVGLPLLRSGLNPSSSLRLLLLRLFGAQIGRGVVVKPGVRVKYPWHLRVGDSSWLGEDCWIDNLGEVRVGSNVCLSQGTYLCTGSHDWNDPRFGLIVKPIQIEDGVWVGARATLLPGSVIGRNAVITAGSVATGSLEPGFIYRGHPAAPWKPRELRSL